MNQNHHIIQEFNKIVSKMKEKKKETLKFKLLNQSEIKHHYAVY